MKHTNLIEQIQKTQTSRNWKSLPASFEQAQVKRLAKIIIEQLRYLDTTGTIKERIAISKASTLDDLLAIVTKH